MPFVTLNAVDTSAERDYLRNRGVRVPARELDFTEDDLEQPVTEAAATNEAVTEAMAEAPVGVYFPVVVNTDDVREFHPRKGARAGTRIVYKNGAARPVKELFAEVKAAFEAA